MLSLLKAAAFIFGHIPLGLAVFLGKTLGRLAFLIDRKRSAVTIENLRAALGDRTTHAERLNIAREVYENLGITLFEFMRIPWLKPGDLDGYVEAEGTERLKGALERGKGVILLTAHLGNWELMAAFYGLTGFPVDVVVRDLDSPLFEEFVQWARTRCGNRIVSKGRAMRPLLKTLAANGIAGILLDQNVALAEGVFVDYFGMPACTNKGPAMLATVSGAAVIPTFIVRIGRTHRVLIGTEIPMVETGDREADAIKNTEAMTRAIEDVVRKHPGQWFWVHRRWKTRPPQES
jgi:KDO2-lipid IV(A) lauroyltransferase